MNKKKFILWQIKKWLPIAIVLFLVIATIVWSTMNNKSLVVYRYDDYYYSYFGPGITINLVMGMIMSFIIPFFVYEYRYNKTASDAYNAFPNKKNEIKTTKLLIGLAIIFIIFTVVYAGNFLILLSRWLSTPETNGRAHRVNINFIIYLPSYFIILGLIITEYLFNCYMVSLGNTIATSSLYVLAGNIILVVLVPTVAEYLIICKVITIKSATYFFGGYASDFLLVEQWLVDLAKGTKVLYELKSIPMLAITLLIRGVSGALCFIEKEPSGEYFGYPKARGKYEKYIIYVALGTLSALMMCISNGPVVIFYVLVLANNYIFLVLSNKTFKLPKEDWIAFFVLLALMIVTSMIAASDKASIYL